MKKFWAFLNEQVAQPPAPVPITTVLTDIVHILEQIAEGQESSHTQQRILLEEIQSLTHRVQLAHERETALLERLERLMQHEAQDIRKIEQDITTVPSHLTGESHPPNP